MHDPEFEKQVQKKLEELQFSPSGDVWTNVEKEIKKEKRRRPLFWIFLVGGLLLSTGFCWLIVSKKAGFHATSIADDNKKSKTNAVAQETNTAKSEDGLIPTGKAVAEHETTNRNMKKRNVSAIKNISKIRPFAIIKPKTSPAEKKRSANDQSVSFFQKNPEKRIGEKVNVVEDKNTLKNKISKSDASHISNDKSTEIVEHPEPGQDPLLAEVPTAGNLNTQKKDTPDHKNANLVSKPGATAVAKRVMRAKSKPFNIGITAGAGGSNIKTFSAGRNVMSTGATTSVQQSSFETGISFYAGAFLEKSLSKRVSLSGGLNYHYYSTHVRIGKTVDSVIFIPAFPVYNYNSSRATPTVSVPAYYRTGTSSKFTDQYHFVELPLLIDFRLNNSKKLPLTWETGISFSYLINANALQFDTSSGTYYKDNSLYNKTQINILTGFTLGLHPGKKLINIGPEFQYGARNLMRNYTGISNHFMYGGLKISMTSGKK